MNTRPAVERRNRGRIVDFRIRFDHEPEPALLTIIENTLRRSDAVLSHEGKEVAIALSGTSVEEAIRVIAPRMRTLIERQRVHCSFLINGRAFS